MRNRDAVRCLALAAIAAVLSFGCARRESFHATAVSTQLARLDAILRQIEKKPPAGLAELLPHHRESLGKASKASAPALRLYRLRDPFVGVETLLYVSSHAAAAKDVSAFEQLWRAEGTAIGRTTVPQGTVLQRALVEGARNRAQVLYRASLPFARTSAPADGLYYLGEAVGNRKFAEFVESLGGDPQEPGPPRDGVEAALEKIDGEMLSAFEKEPTGKTTIPASALSKECHELLRRGWTDGALLTLLEARIALSKRTGAAVPDTSLKPGSRDDSMSILIAALSKESDPDIARIVRAQVAPMFAALSGTRERTKTAAGPVRITLVRWPYT